MFILVGCLFHFSILLLGPFFLTDLLCESESATLVVTVDELIVKEFSSYKYLRMDVAVIFKISNYSSCNKQACYIRGLCLYH